MKKFLIVSLFVIAGLAVGIVVIMKTMTKPDSIFNNEYYKKLTQSVSEQPVVTTSESAQTVVVSDKDTGLSDVYIGSNKNDTETQEEIAESIPVSLVGADEAYLVSVIDGDTLVLFLTDGSGDQKVRLIGVDTPESVAWDEYLKRTGKENTEEGKDASAFMSELLNNEVDGAGGMLYVKYDVSRYDKYGRTLAYVYLPDGRMLQDILLEAGMARIMTVAPNVAYADHFVELQRKAQKEKVGFWSGDFWNAGE